MTSPEPKKTRGMCIATRCTSVEQFIQMFHRFVDEESFFVSTLNTRPPGLETPFSVQLADGTPVLRGLCVVLQAWTDSMNPFKTPGVRLGIKRLTANSMLVFEQLLVTRSGKLPAGLAKLGPATQPGPGVAPLATGSTKLPTVLPPLPRLTPPGAGAVPAPRSPFAETAPTKLALSRGISLQPTTPPSAIAQTQPLGSRTTAAVAKPSTPAAPSPPPAAPSPAPPSAATKASTPATQSQPAAAPSPAPPVRPPTPDARDGAPRTAAPTEQQLTTPIESSAAPTPIAQEPTEVLEEKTEVRETKVPPPTSAPIEGTRTPGSDLILPANPLMNLSDESLRGYVDCTLYEETGNFFPTEEDVATAVDDVAPPPLLAPRPAIRSAPHAPTRPPSTGSQTTPETELDAKRFETSPHLPPPPSVPASPADAAASPISPDNGAAPPASAASAPPPAEAAATPVSPLHDALDPAQRDGVDPAPIARGSAPVLPVGSAQPFPGPDAPGPLDGAPPDALAGAMAAPRDVAAASPVMVPRRAADVPLHKQRRVWLIGGGGALALIVIVALASSSSDSPAAPAATKPVAALGSDDDATARGTAGPQASEARTSEARSDDGVTGDAPAGDGSPRDTERPAPGDDDASEPAGDDPSSGDTTAEEPHGNGESAASGGGNGPPLVGSGPCRVVVMTTPAGSTIKLDGNAVGPSPLTIAASCERHKLDVSHPRYQTASRFVSLTEGKAHDLEVTLTRPTHIVTVTSQPSGATIFLDGRRAGTTPTKLSVLGFVTVKLEFKKTGYQPVSTKLYSKRAHDSVAVRLRRW